MGTAKSFFGMEQFGFHEFVGSNERFKLIFCDVLFEEKRVEGARVCGSRFT